MEGRRDAQYRLYQLYSGAMYNICLRFMRTKEEAEDMLQESFTTAFRRLTTYRFDAPFGSWLKQIVINHCINTLKRKKAELVYVQDMTRQDRPEVNDENNEDEVKMNVMKIHKAIEQLPEGSRIILSLYLLEGYDHTEIAQIMDISESTSKTQYMRAKNKVLELIKQMN